jgi:UDP-glucuronate 4-epimerase
MFFLHFFVFSVRVQQRIASEMNKKRIFITGTSGFIGYHLAERLLAEGHIVHGYDGMTDYYDVGLKQNRRNRLLKNTNFSNTEAMLEDENILKTCAYDFRPNIIIHLAAQAGVRYSIENPKSYINSNLVGFFNIMDLARDLKVEHFLLASTSSVYGSNTDMPFNELQKTDTQLSLYAATKKSNESMAHAYSHLWNIPTTVLRFFTVYGPWGRPDLALFKFVDAILDHRPIEIYNNGNMFRDFTYVEDLVMYINRILYELPKKTIRDSIGIHNDSLSPVAPYRVINIGNSEKIGLLDFVETIERELGVTAIKTFLPMQAADVQATWADTHLLNEITGINLKTSYETGIKNFILWFRDYYKK